MTLIRTSDQIDSAWLRAALGRDGLEVGTVESIGTGQMSLSFRVSFTDEQGAPGTVVVKLAAEDPTSRGTGVGMGAYLREISFYNNLAERIGDPLAACHLALYDDAEGWFTLVLEEVEGAVQGDQIRGCTVEEARIAMRELARVHAPVLGDLALGTSAWLNQPNPLNQALLTQLLPLFLERYADRVSPEHAEVCKRFVASADGWAQDVRPPVGLVHGDYRLDNLLFDGTTCKVVDWQTVSWGPAMRDASYFLGAGLLVEDRREHEEELVRLYHEEVLRHGVTGFTWEQCWEEYRRQVFHGLTMAIAASIVTQRTDRGDDMFMVSTERAAQQALDLGSLELLPEPDAGRPEPLQPKPEDEGRHAPGPEELWNESWYFDAVSESGDLGVYVRLGRLPNREEALYVACITGPDRPSIMLTNAAAPLPDTDDDAQRIAIDGLTASQHCEEPLKRFRVVVEGEARSHEDHAGPLLEQEGEPVGIAMDLTWVTEGVPYAWRQSTRYEIPCRVSGTVRVGDEEIAFEGPGQRDHSWGARDWWAVDWMWSALHLEDGTRTHAVGVPQMPGYGVGYTQRDGEVLEIESVTATQEIHENGLVEHARIASGPDELVLDVEPLGFGAIRLAAPDGRVSFFPRAMCRVSTQDGRTGLGWVEWNRVQRPGE